MKGKWEKQTVWFTLKPAPVIKGEYIFYLADTHGLPYEVSFEMCKTHGRLIEIDSLRNACIKANYSERRIRGIISEYEDCYNIYFWAKLAGLDVSEFKRQYALWRETATSKEIIAHRRVGLLPMPKRKPSQIFVYDKVAARLKARQKEAQIGTSRIAHK